MSWGKQCDLARLVGTVLWLPSAVLLGSKCLEGKMLYSHSLLLLACCGSLPKGTMERGPSLLCTVGMVPG